MSRPENAVPDTASPRYRENSAQPASTQTRGPNNELKISPMRSIFENVSKSDFIRYQENVSIGRAHHDESRSAPSSVHEHSTDSQVRNDIDTALGSLGYNYRLLSSPPRRKPVPVSSESKPSPETHQEKPNPPQHKQPLQRGQLHQREQSPRPFVDASPKSGTQATSSNYNKSHYSSRIKRSLLTSTEDALVILTWLSGDFDPADFDQPGSRSQSITTQRLEFHQMGVLKGIKTSNWPLIGEDGSVVYTILNELRDAELAVLNSEGKKLPTGTPYVQQHRNTRLITKFWQIFRYFTRIILRPSTEFTDYKVDQNILELSMKYPGAALQRMVRNLINTVFSVQSKNLDEAKKSCTKLFDDIDVLGTHEKIFSAQMRTVAHLIMVGILRGRGENAEAKFYIAQVRRVKDHRKMVWVRWAILCVDDDVDLKIDDN
ncbi:hypothetical protein TWF281_011427 [Arthrobotrys megalospora]